MIFKNYRVIINDCHIIPNCNILKCYSIVKSLNTKYKFIISKI